MTDVDVACLHGDSVHKLLLLIARSPMVFSVSVCFIQYNTIQYSTIQYNAMQCNAMQCKTMQYSTVVGGEHTTKGCEVVDLCAERYTVPPPPSDGDVEASLSLWPAGMAERCRVTVV